MNIELRGILKEYKSGPALDQVSLAIEPGQIVAFLGANGAGKTTLLRLLAGIIGPDNGQVLYDNEPFTRGKMHLRKRFQFLPDFPPVFDAWTLIWHIGMVLRLYEIDPATREDRAVQVLSDLDLLPIADTPFAAMSRGQRYKGALAALLALNPEVWLLDEPFASGMDPHGINTLKREARAAAAQGHTIIYTTQILDAAERFSDRICVLHRGKIRAFAPTQEIRAHAKGDSSGLEEIFAALREEDTK